MVDGVNLYLDIDGVFLGGDYSGERGIGLISSRPLAAGGSPGAVLSGLMALLYATAFLILCFAL
jgi:hypothetical protein